MQSYLIFFLTLFISEWAKAAQVIDVQGSNITIEADAEDMLVATEKYFVLNGQNKRVGIISIISTTDNTSQAELLKGSAKEGYKLVPYEQPAAKPVTAAGNAKNSSRKTSINLGIFAEIMINSLSVTLGTTNVSMSGTSFAFAFAYQHKLTETLKARYPIGIRSYGVQAQNAFCTTGNCSLSVTYLSLGGKLDYLMGDSVSVGAGFEYLLPVSKSSSFLSSEQIAANSLASLGAGWLISPNVPISFSYNIFLGNKDVPASFLAIQTGYLW